MIQKSLTPISQVILRFAALLLLFSISRIIFWVFNFSIFSHLTLYAFVAGIRFDIEAIVLLNGIYFLFLLLPFNFVTLPISQTIGNYYYVCVNAIGILMNLIDTCYYPFSMRRMTGDIFDFLHQTNNWSDLIPVFIRDYWYIALFFIVFIALLVFIVVFTKNVNNANFVYRSRRYIVQIAVRVVCIALLILGFRGGWQYRPLNIAAAGDIAGIENAAVVLNTPFSLLTTLSAKGLEKKNYMSEEACEQIFSLQSHFPHTHHPICSIPPQNVVLIILEGISSEYITPLAKVPQSLCGFTPFLDSLLLHSMVFQGEANGHQSIESLSSILGGIPSLMNQSFSQSQYVTNVIDYAIPLLNRRGMHTAFFHGGKNGTMGFDRYCRLLGIQAYYGLNEYPKHTDYDGSWGIADVPYLQYVAHEISNYKNPFFATIYTLSSHHPFIVPAEYEPLLPKGGNLMQHSIAYTDEALRQFFANVSQTNWYKNTLFVITADHTNFTGAENVDYEKNRYAIPMVFFYPQADTSFISQQIVQQLDIMPSIFDFCQWEGDFCSFGHSAFDSDAPHFAINLLADHYQFRQDNYLIEFDGKNIVQVLNLAVEEHRKLSDYRSIPHFTQREKLLKAVLQQYHNRLVNNDLRVSYRD